MNLPRELYVIIYQLTDDIDVTKSLRLVNKKLYDASYDYFKMLLKMPVIIKCNDDSPI